MSSNTTNMNIPTNMVGIVENLMEISKLGVDWDVVVAGQIVGKMAKATPEPTRSVGATDEEIQEMLDKSKNAYNLFCAKNFREAEKENPDPANRKETYRILGPRWTALKNDDSRYEEFRSYHVPYLKEDAISMSGRKWKGIPATPEEPNVIRIDEHDEFLDEVTERSSQGSEYERKTWTCLICTKQNIRGVYNCVCCGRIVGTVPDHPGLYWNSSVQVWDVPRGESKVKRGYNNYAYHYREHFKGQGFSKRNITRKISAGWRKKTPSEKEQWADWEWARAEMKRVGWDEMRESCPYKK